MARRVTAAIVAVIALVFLFGCFEASTTSEAYSFAWDWVEYQISHQAAGALAYPVGTRTGDPEADAALDMRRVIDDTEKAEELAEDAERALARGDEKMAQEDIENAIRRRPGDWRYRYQAAAYALVVGDDKEVARQTRVAEECVRVGRPDAEVAASDAIDAYEGAFNAVQAGDDRDAKARVLGVLAENYEKRGDAYFEAGRKNDAVDDYAKAQEYRDLLGEL